jgi:Arc/MetJ-type ribon-helix-helix transcriptional regulator
MTLTVRLPLRVEQELAEYCATRKVSKSEVVKEALDLLLAKTKSQATAYELGKDLFDADDTVAKGHIPYSKYNLRDLVRSRANRR